MRNHAPSFNGCASRDSNRASPARPHAGSLGWVFDLYRQTTAWTDLAASRRYKREKIMLDAGLGNGRE